MARIPEAEIQRLKDEVSVAHLAQSSGLELKQSGKDFTARCPFHADDTASLVITPEKNGPSALSISASSYQKYSESASRKRQRPQPVRWRAPARRVPRPRARVRQNGPPGKNPQLSQVPSSS